MRTQVTTACSSGNGHGDPCSGKAAGDSCSYTGRAGGTMSSTCHAAGGGKITCGDHTLAATCKAWREATNNQADCSFQEQQEFRAAKILQQATVKCHDGKLVDEDFMPAVGSSSCAVNTTGSLPAYNCSRTSHSELKIERIGRIQSVTTSTCASESLYRCQIACGSSSGCNNRWVQPKKNGGFVDWSCCNANAEDWPSTGAGACRDRCTKTVPFAAAACSAKLSQF